MSVRRTRTCADCGKRVNATPTMLPQGQYRCHPCRRARPVKGQRTRTKPRRATGDAWIPCADCGDPRPTNPGSLPAGQRVCRPCRRKRLGFHDQPTPLDYLRARRARGLVPGKHKVRAKHYGVEYEPVNPRRVFARDRWRCGICGGKVNPQLSWPDPMSASIDHVLPMSQGGGHTYANTQCSHLTCNASKQARGGGEQLALIG